MEIGKNYLKHSYYTERSDMLNKAYLLWLKYDYETEMYDQHLPNVPSPNNDGSVMPVGRWLQVSNQNAMKCRKTIYEIANHYCIPTEVMSEEKRYRQRYTTKKRLEEYEWILNNRPEDLEFINQYLEYKKQYQSTYSINENKFFNT
jgi:hypothetical protein